MCSSAGFPLRCGGSVLSRSDITSMGESGTGASWALVAIKDVASASKTRNRCSGRKRPILMKGKRIEGGREDDVWTTEAKRRQSRDWIGTRSCRDGSTRSWSDYYPPTMGPERFVSLVGRELVQSPRISDCFVYRVTVVTLEAPGWCVNSSTSRIRVIPMNRCQM